MDGMGNACVYLYTGQIAFPSMAYYKGGDPITTCIRPGMIRQVRGWGSTS